MFSLALADFLSGFYDGFVDELLPLLGLSLDLVNSSLCAICTFMNRLTTIASFWITALFSVDKCFAVIFPYRYRVWGKPKVCVVATLTVYILNAALTVPDLFVLGVDNEYSGMCHAVKFDILSRYLYFELRTPIIILFGAGLPTATVVICALVTLIKIRLDQRKRSDQSGTSKQRNSPRARLDAEITRQMIVVCFLFGVIMVTSSAIIRVNHGSEPKTAGDEAKYTLLDRINSVLTSMINAANFYLYLIFGKKFRNDFKRLFQKQNGE